MLPFLKKLDKTFDLNVRKYRTCVVSSEIDNKKNQTKIDMNRSESQTGMLIMNICEFNGLSYWFNFKDII